jgi:hypothetical protein
LSQSEIDFTVEKYTHSKKKEWDAFVRRAKNATFLFQRDFMDYHSDRFQDFSLMIYRNGKLFALLPANTVADKVISHQGLTYGSFILSEKAKLLDAFEAFRKMLIFLNEQGKKVLEVRLIPKFYNTLPADELEYFCFQAKATLKKRDVIMAIDYEHNLGFQKNRREGINKAKRHGLTVRLEENFKDFWEQILIPNLQRKHDAEPVHTLAEIEQLAKDFPENIKQVNVYDDTNTIVAGTTVFLTDTTVHPQYVSGNQEKNTLGSLDLLYDFIMNEFKDDRRYFDFNTSSEEGGKVLSEGLLFWKESCGARAFSFDTYQIDTAVANTLKIPLL